MAETVSPWTAGPTHRCPALSTEDVGRRLNYHLLGVKRLGSAEEPLSEKTGGINAEVKKRPARVVPRQSAGLRVAAAEGRCSEVETLSVISGGRAGSSRDASCSPAVALLLWSLTEHMLQPLNTNQGLILCFPEDARTLQQALGRGAWYDGSRCSWISD